MKIEELEILDKYLADQGYTRRKLRDTVVRAITSNEADYPGIQLAYDSEYTDRYNKKLIEKTAENILMDIIYPEIIIGGPDFEFDYDDYAYDMVTDDTNDSVRDYLYELESEFEYLIDKANEDYDAQMDYQNREYIDSVMPR